MELIIPKAGEFIGNNEAKRLTIGYPKKKLVDHFPMKIAIYWVHIGYILGIYIGYILFSDPMMLHQWIQVTVR